MSIGGPNIYPSAGGWNFSPGIRTISPVVTFTGSGHIAPSRGIEGFDDKTAREGISVTGIRWWTLRPGVVLKGACAEWVPGRNEAVCLVGHPHQVPAPECSCGFWAYWQDPIFFGAWNGNHFSTPRFAVNESDVPVCGIIDGWGRTLAGPKGFRSEKAKITALLVPPAYKEQAAAAQPQAMIYTSMRAMTGEHPPGCGRENPGLPE